MSASKQFNPICKERRKNCFGYNNGKCRVLVNAEFKEQNCPFFKTREQYMREMKK